MNMASLLVKHAAIPAPRALATKSRTVLSARTNPFAHGQAALTSRYFSQTFRLREKRYTESHEWVSFSPDKKTCKIGVSTYAAEALGDVVYIELPEKGSEVEQGENFGSVESVKSASDIMSPVSGSVIEANDALVETPAGLGKDPEGEGWLVQVEVTDASGAEGLMDADAYAEFTKEEE